MAITVTASHLRTCLLLLLLLLLLTV